VRRSEDLHIIGFNDLNLADDVLVRETGAIQFDTVAQLNVLEPPKKTVSMSCYSEVSGLSKMCGSQDTAQATIKRQVVCVIEKRRLKIDCWNTKNREGKVGLSR
jgi:hypothetical protein